MSKSETTIAPPRRWPGARLASRMGLIVGDLRLDGGIVAMFVVSRLLLVVAAVVAEAFISPNPNFTHAAGGPLIQSLASWDAGYYLGIATGGYHAQAVVGAYRDVAFAPLYPALVGVLSIPWAAYASVVAVLVSNVAFLFALVLLARLGTPYLGRRRAALAAGFMAIYPFASVFGMAYSESLFLLFVVAAFLAAETRHRAWAGVFLALAVLTRIQGLGLILPLWILMLRQDEWRPRWSQGWLLLGPLALAGFVAYLAALTGSFTAIQDAQAAWRRTGIGSFSSDTTVAARFTPYQAALLVTLAWSVFLLVFVGVDRRRPEYWLVPVIFIAEVLAGGTLESVGRYTMLAFPYMWILAKRRSLFARRTWPLVSAGLFTAIAVATFTGYWVP